jgi:hypothetical protein
MFAAQSRDARTVSDPLRSVVDSDRDEARDAARFDRARYVRGIDEALVPSEEDR